MTIIRSKHIHAPGIITVVTDRSNTDKDSIFACSSDETFCIWTYSAEGEFIEDINNCSNNCRGVLAVFGEDIYIAETAHDSGTGLDQQVVVKYGKCAFLSSIPLLTFSLEVTALVCDGNYLIAGANDFIVKCLSLNDPKVCDRYECEHVIVNLSISPNSEFFTISSADGNVQVRNVIKSMAPGNGKKPLAKFKTCSQFSHITTETSRMQCTWLSDSSKLFIPAKAGVLVISADNWNQERILGHPDVAYGTFSVTAISSDEKFLVGTTLEGTVLIWTIAKSGFELLTIKSKITQGIGTLTSAVFNPTNDGTLVLAYSEGYLCAVPNATSTGKSITGQKSSNGKPAIGVSAVEGEDAIELDEQEDDIDTDIGRIKSQYGFDENGIHISEKTDALTSAYGTTPNAHSSIQFARPIIDQPPCATIKGMRLPKLFASGSTPIQNSQRYLAWNAFGVIRSYQTSEESTVEITFHDATIHSEITLDNTNSNYVFGDMNDKLVALASQKNSNKESELMVQLIRPWDIDSRQWSQTMSRFEVIECLAIGQEFIAVVTSLRHLRVFTATGAQRVIVSLTAPVLTMCAFQRSLAIAHPTGAVLVTSEDDYEHQLNVDLYELDPLAPGIVVHLARTFPIALSPDAVLKWLQFSTAGCLVAMDSECIVRLFHTPRRLWLPIVAGADLLKDPDADFIWPIAVVEFPVPQFRYVYCKGAKYPSANKSSHVPTTVSWSIPVLNGETDRGRIEDELMVTEIQQATIRALQNSGHFHQSPAALLDPQLLGRLTQTYVANLVKFFAISCQSGKECRAAELARRVTTSQGIQAMCVYASKKQRPNLSEKVAEIGRERMKGSSTLANYAQFSMENEANFSTQRLTTTLTTSAERPVDSQLKSSLQLATSGRVVLPKRKPQLAPPTSTYKAFADITQQHTDRESLKEKDDDAEQEVQDQVSAYANTTLNYSSVFDTSSALNDTSLFLNDSVLDSAIIPSPFNNPFKRARLAAATTTPIDDESSNERRGIDEDAVMDFFDSLSGEKTKENTLNTLKKFGGKEIKKSKKQATLNIFASKPTNTKQSVDGHILQSNEDQNNAEKESTVATSPADYEEDN